MPLKRENWEQWSEIDRITMHDTSSVIHSQFPTISTCSVFWHQWERGSSAILFELSSHADILNPENSHEQHPFLSTCPVSPFTYIQFCIHSTLHWRSTDLLTTVWWITSFSLFWTQVWVASVVLALQETLKTGISYPNYNFANLFHSHPRVFFLCWGDTAYF